MAGSSVFLGSNRMCSPAISHPFMIDWKVLDVIIPMLRFNNIASASNKLIVMKELEHLGQTFSGW